MGRSGTPPRGSPWYERVAARLDPADLQAPGPGEADPLEEALRAEPRREEGALFLGYYTRAGLERALEAYGFLDKLREKGLRALDVRLERTPEGPPRVQVHGGEEHAHEHLLVELAAHATRWQSQAGEVHDVIAIDWLTLRDPRARFTTQRPRLPGQDVPGLGVGRDVLEMLFQSAKRLGSAGVVAYPEHFHNAILYGRRFRYHSPELEGRVRAVRRAAAGARLADASWAVEWGCLLDQRTGEPVPWSAFRGEQVMPVDEPLAARYRTTWYRLAAETAEREARYAFDWDAYGRRLAEAIARAEPRP